MLHFLTCKHLTLQTYYCFSYFFVYNVCIYNREHKNSLEQNEEMFVKEDYIFRVRARDCS